MAWRSLVLAIYFSNKNEFCSEKTVNEIIQYSKLLPTDNLEQAIKKITFTIKIML